MSKLTLSVDDAVVERAKRFAKARGTSISKMVETYLSAVAEPPARLPPDTPVLKIMRGSLKKADLKDYKRHLDQKYR